MTSQRWISKKDKDGNLKHIPIQPYGESRAKAEKTVENLRKLNERSRLIKTNQRMNLYAPYRSVLDEKGKARLVPKSATRDSNAPIGAIIKDISGLSRADVSVLLRNPRGHRLEVIPLSGGKFNVVIGSKDNESKEEFEGFTNGMGKIMDESRGKRLNRSQSTSQFQLHTTSQDERNYAESVKKYLEQDSTFRGLPEEKRRIVLGYMNIGLNGYFNTVEDEEGAIGKGAEWDYMDAMEFPVREIVKEAQKSGSSAHKAERVGELVQEWMGTEGGRPNFG